MKATRILVTGSGLAGARTSLISLARCHAPSTDYARHEDELIRGRAEGLELRLGEHLVVLRQDIRSNLFLPSLLTADPQHQLAGYWRRTLEFAKHADGQIFVLDTRTVLEDYVSGHFEQAKTLWRDVGRSPEEIPGIVAANLRNDGEPRSDPRAFLERIQSPWRDVVEMNALTGVGVAESVEALVGKIARVTR